jgi:hypothetical protein
MDGSKATDQSLVAESKGQRVDWDPADEAGSSCLKKRLKSPKTADNQLR